MQRGRPTKNPELKKLSGTYRPPKAMEGPLLETVPEPPQELNPEVRSMFKNACSILINKKMLHPEDIHLVVIFAQEYWTYLQAVKALQTPEDHINTTASGYLQPSPWVNIRNTAQKSVREVGSLIGLDPFGRGRMGVKDTEEEGGLLEQLMGRSEKVHQVEPEEDFLERQRKREEDLNKWMDKASKEYEEKKNSGEYNNR